MTPIFGQQRQLNSYSLPMGGNNFMRANQIGGPSRINVIRMPQANPQRNVGSQSSLRPPGATFGQSPLRPPGATFRLGESSFEDRAKKYQQDLAEFNLGQKESELEKRQAEADEIASGRFTIDGQAVTRAEMDQYMQNAKSSAARAQTEFDRADPFYARARQFVNQNFAQPRPKMPGESQEEYQRRLDYHYNNTRVQKQNITERVYNQMRENALIRSIEQFRDDPTAYLMGGGMGQRTNTIAPNELMSYLSQARQMFQLTGGEGNFIDNLLGRNPEGTVQRRVVIPLNRLLVGSRTADEQADIDYANFLRRNSITGSEGTRPLTEQDKRSFLQRLRLQQNS